MQQKKMNNENNSNQLARNNFMRPSSATSKRKDATVLNQNLINNAQG